MYRKKEDLKHLVASLSMSEKRYFSLFIKSFSSAKGADPLYLKLFSSLDECTYSDDFNKASVRAQSHATKRLYDNILKGLLLYHHNGSVDIIIQNLLIQIEILYHLALPGQSLPLLNKAYRLAHLHEKFGLLLQILQWERKISIIIVSPGRRIEEIAGEEQEVLAKLAQITHLESIYSKAIELKRQLGYVDNHKELASKTISSPMMPALAECNTQKAIFYHHFIHALYYRMVYDHKQAYRHSKQLANSPIQFILPNDYIDGLLHHINSCLCLGYFEETLKVLRVLDVYMRDQKMDQSDSFRVLMFYYKAFSHLLIYNYVGKKEALLNTIQKTEEQLTLYDEKLSMEMKQVIWGNLCNAYVGIGAMDKAGNIMEWLFRKESKLVRKEIYNDLYLFRLFYLLQRKMYVLLPSMALSAYRYFKQQKNSEVYFEVELKIAALLLEEHDYENMKTLHSVLQQIRQMLIAHIAHLKGVHNFQEHYSFYIIWAESIFYERPFYEQTSVWYKQNMPRWNLI